MKKYFYLIMALFLASCMQDQTKTYTSFAEYPAYSEENLWTQYTPEATTFTIWSPPAEAVMVRFYENGTDGASFDHVSLEKVKEGLWRTSVKKDLKGVYYTFQVKVNGEWLNETPGVYAQAVGVNGYRAMVVDLESTNPDDWDKDQRLKINTPNEAIIYELHVRDLTISPNSGSAYPGKFLGLVEAGTKGPEDISTGIDHLKELGITHVHLLPSFDHYSIDETKLDSAQFNWGYDPHNYNVPEGSFATDPYNAEVRIREFKEMVKTFHDNGIGVILDVVYNHTGRTPDDTNFTQEVPGYYYRQKEDGSYSDASACGNETASERPMVRKFIKESVAYWAREYHLDGFRFDLMGIHDIETMNEIADTLKTIDPSIFVYGEGWTAGGSPLPENDRALKKFTYRMPNITAFSDDIRDGIKGSVFEEKSTGFASGAADTEESIKFGVVGSTFHPEIDYVAVNYSDTAWTNDPWQAVSYVSCHDNHTLFDKFTVSRPDATKAEVTAMQKLANGIVLTTQGIPFLHAGSEMMRTKGGEHNSYNKPDSINQIDWNWKLENREVFDYYRDLIALRKKHPAFSMPSGNMVREHLSFKEVQPGLVGFQISDNANGDSWKEVLVYYNANQKPQTIQLDGKWRIAALGGKVDEAGWTEKSGKLSIPAISMLIAFQK